MFFTPETPIILVVDDEPVNVEILATLLSRDYHVKVTGYGETALEIAQNDPQPDLILLDVMMPGMDGYEVCRRLKADPRTCDIPVIFITAAAGEPSESRGLQLGAIDYITKPFNHTITLLRVKNTLDYRRSQQALLERGGFLDALIQNAPYAVWVLSDQGRWLLLNKIAHAFLGYASLQHANSSDSFNFIDADYRPVYRHMVQQAMNGETTREELKMTSPPSQICWLELSVSPLTNAQGSIVAVLTIASNISQRKLDESRLRLSAKVFENTQEGILFTNSLGDIEDVNPAFSRITGYSRAEVLGQNPRLLNAGLQSADFYPQFWESLKTKGQWQGELWNRRKDGQLLPEWLSVTAIADPRGQIEHYLGVFSDITQIKQHEEQLEKTAHYDILTGIPNRILLSDRMKQAIAQSSREQKMMAVCYLDLDGFKPINDDLGHAAGDQVLIICAQRIKKVIREMDTVARLGGDEFVILLQNVEHLHECAKTLDRLLAAIAEPLTVENRVCELSASIGVTLYPIDSEDPDMLLRHADQAMYTAKQSGKNRYHIYDAEQDDRLRCFNDKLQRIQHGLDNNEFELFYQPKVDLQTRQIVGAEARIRWHHPELGLQMPRAFLPFIQQTALELVLGEWVIDQALAQLQNWRQLGLRLELSVNISASHLQANDFVSTLHEKLAAYPDLVAGGLQIEILESVALEDFDTVRSIISACGHLGVSFALDDFGTGYSSLTYLRNLPIETIKIDQTFVRDMLHDSGDFAIIQGVITLSKAFDRKIVAEGVETEAHIQMLAGMGCDIVQGYAIARPMPNDEFSKWCRENTAYPFVSTENHCS